MNGTYSLKAAKLNRKGAELTDDSLFSLFLKAIMWRVATYKYSQIKMRRDGRSEAAAGLP